MTCLVSFHGLQDRSKICILYSWSTRYQGGNQVTFRGGNTVKCCFVFIFYLFFSCLGAVFTFRADPLTEGTWYELKQTGNHKNCLHFKQLLKTYFICYYCHMQIKKCRKYLQYLDKSPEKKWCKGNITVKMCESLLHMFHHITKSFFHPTYHL